jgi:hypothetical protein
MYLNTTTLAPENGISKRGIMFIIDPRTNLNQPSSNVDYDDECFQEREGLFAALDYLWILRATLALARILGAVQEGQPNSVDTSTDACKKM